ncbi:solute carrier family 22 member 4 [Elysia marginata]|uniref:Solute carrier family 22 member 4 n=1 Tax=Elysia marginata TaxID=1093978 RepID=A0AAV4HDX6_9GAST|nr:solute carrier family 22 member 4 [Elysia marginata]
MLGGLVFGDLADRFGRRLSMAFTMYATLVVSFVSAFSVNYTMFVCLRFLLGVLQQGLQNTVYTLVIELYQPQHRPYAGVIVELFFSSSIMILAGLAYAIRYWRHLQITVALIPMVTVIYPWVIPESLRWLVMKGQTEQAEKQIQRICKTNKIPFPDEIWAVMKKSKRVNVRQKQQYNVTHLFRTWSLMKITLICGYLWVTISSTYYGLTFKVTSLKGNPYLNFFLSGLIETIMATLCLPIMNRFGRKKPVVVGLIFCAVMCLTSGFFNSFTSGLDKLVTAFGLVGKCAGSSTFIIFFVYTTELYPTVVRNVGLGFGMFWARLGGVMAPQLNQWISVLLGFDVIYLFGTLSLIGGLIAFPLPETHRRSLPDSIEEEITLDEGGLADIANTNMESKLGVDEVTTGMEEDNCCTEDV